MKFGFRVFVRLDERLNTGFVIEPENRRVLRECCVGRINRGRK